MLKIKSWQWAGIVLLVAVAGLIGYGFWPKIVGTAEADTRRETDERVSSRRANVDVLVIQPTEFVIRVEATGRLKPWREAALSTEASGVVWARPHEEGDVIQMGEVLLRLDDRDQEITLREAESDLLNAQVEFATFTAFREESDVDTTAVAEARKDYAAALMARADGSISSADLATIRRQLDVTVLRGGGRREEVEAVVSGLAQAESRADRARLALSRTAIRAPFSGQLADIQVEIGQRVGPGQLLFSLLDQSQMRVEVDVLEADLAYVKRGGSALVRIPALADTALTGTVFSINPAVDPARGTGRVTVLLPNRSGLLISGLFAYVELEAGRLADRIVVPSGALLVRQGKDLVFLVNGGKAKWTYVTVGRRSGDFVEITEHLAAGDSLAVAGHHALSHDASVRVENVVEVVH